MSRQEAKQFIVDNADRLLADVKQRNPLAIDVIITADLYLDAADRDSVINHHLYFTIAVERYRNQLLVLQYGPATL